MALKELILNFLYEMPYSGYDLIKDLDNSIDLFWRFYPSQVYRDLEQLEKNECVSSTIVKQDKNPDKKIYSITDEGKRYLKEWLSRYEADKLFFQRQDFLLRMFCADHMEDRTINSMLDDLSKEIVGLQSKITEIKSGIDDYEDSSDNLLLYKRLTLDFGDRIYNVVLDWVENAKTEIKKAKEQELIKNNKEKKEATGIFNLYNRKVEFESSNNGASETFDKEVRSIYLMMNEENSHEEYMELVSSIDAFIENNDNDFLARIYKCATILKSARVVNGPIKKIATVYRGVDLVNSTFNSIEKVVSYDIDAIFETNLVVGISFSYLPSMFKKWKNAKDFLNAAYNHSNFSDLQQNRKIHVLARMSYLCNKFNDKEGEEKFRDEAYRVDEIIFKEYFDFLI